MHAIGRYIRDESASLDVVLLQELWMRPDHDVIQSYLDQVCKVIFKTLLRLKTLC